MNSAKSDPPPAQRIAAVVVTFNRLALLQECVAALRAQTRRPDEIIVVNNSSTDGTAEWLAGQPDLTVVTQENSGSSGGQFTGIKTAYERGHDWFWCMDDDTIPAPTALHALVNSRPYYEASTGFLSSLTLDKNGAVDGIVSPTPTPDWFVTVVDDHCVRVDQASFVSVMYARRAVGAVGLPLRWMFIWGEDLELSRRVAGRFKGWTVLDSRVLHKYVSQPTGGDPYADRNFRERSLYRIRNEIVRIRVDPLIGRFGKLLGIFNAVYQAGRLMARRRMPLKTLSWVWDGMFRRVRFEYPDGS